MSQVIDCLVDTDGHCLLSSDSLAHHVKRMAFAQEIYDKAKKSYNRQMNDAKNHAVTQFKITCTKRAEAGMFTAEAAPHLRDYFSDEFLEAMDTRTGNKILNIIKKATSRLGFKEVKITGFDSGFVDPKDEDFMRIRMSTNWNDTPTPFKYGSNVEAKCPICIETKLCVLSVWRLFLVAISFASIVCRL